MIFNERGYNTYTGGLSASSPPIPPDPLPDDWNEDEFTYVQVTPNNLTCRRWIVFNDSLTDNLYVKVNNIKNDAILVKSGEFFGDNFDTTAVYLKNGSTTSTLDYRVIVSGVVVKSTN
jgi:hypothetical protein